MTDGPIRLLYIDDDPALRRLVQRRLGAHGFETTLAANGYEGVAQARSTPFDIIAVDHHMPGIDGMQTLADLLALPACPPVVYVTGADDGRLAAAALRAGAYDYVVKTVGEDFIELLRSAFLQSLERVRLRQAKERAESELIASNQRLASLLREVNHRVANNLQMTMSFIGMQASALPAGEARDALLASQQRIGAIAQVNRHLYATGNVESVAMDEYLANLARDLAESWTAPTAVRRVTVEADPIELLTDQAVTLGIIISELVANACKYAYPANSEGEICVRLISTGKSDLLRMVVEDRGIGLGETVETKGTGLGKRLVKAMARGLGAEIRLETADPGLRVMLDFTPRRPVTHPD